MTGKENDKDFDLIAAYFNLELSDEEMTFFEQRLDKDASFAKRVLSYKKSIDVVDNEFPDQEVMQRQERWKQMISKKKASRNMIRLRWVSNVAAALLIFLLIYIVIPVMPRTPDYDKLLGEAWAKNVGLDFVVRNTNDDKALVISALKAYERQDYKTALKLLNNHDSLSVHYKDILLLRALATYKNKDSKNALKYLDTLQRHAPSISKWYKGLIYLEAKDLESAKNYIVIPEKSNLGIKLKN